MLTVNNEKSHSPSPQQKDNEQTNKTNESPQGPNSETSSFPATEFLLYLFTSEFNNSISMMKSCKNEKEKQNEKKNTHTHTKTYFVILELHSYTLTNLETSS